MASSAVLIREKCVAHLWSVFVRRTDASAAILFAGRLAQLTGLRASHFATGRTFATLSLSHHSQRVRRCAQEVMGCAERDPSCNLTTQDLPCD